MEFLNNALDKLHEIALKVVDKDNFSTNQLIAVIIFFITILAFFFIFLLISLADKFTNGSDELKVYFLIAILIVMVLFAIIVAIIVIVYIIKKPSNESENIINEMKSMYGKEPGDKND